MNKSELQNLFYSKVPVTEKMGIEVLTCSVEKIEIKSPLSINHNHLGTAFGGSLTAMQALCCWSWLTNFLVENNISAQIVIHKSESKYIKPVTEDIKAVCEAPTLKAQEKFKDSLVKKSKARIKLISTVESAGVLATQFEGSYVAIVKN